jgi:membrane protein implicated in regulation of membrane protease activity
MSDKPNFALIAAVIAAPICCLFLPVLVGAAAAGAFGWLGGLGPVAAIALMAVAGVLVYTVLRFRRRRACARPEDSHLPTLSVEATDAAWHEVVRSGAEEQVTPFPRRR